jgi:hypothetical protein
MYFALIHSAARRSVLVLVCGLVIAAASLCDTAGAALLREAKICSVHKCSTLVTNDQVRIFLARARHPDREAYESTFAQWLPTGRVTALGDEDHFEGPTVQGRPALSGRFVAYALQTEAERYPDTGFGEHVGRLNVQTGRRELIPADGEVGPGFGHGSPGVTDVVVTPAGSVAWMIDGSFGDPSGALLAPGETPPISKAILLLAAGSKTPVPLAYSPMIDPESLAAIPGHVYWLEAGTARTFGAP